MFPQCSGGNVFWESQMLVMLRINAIINIINTHYVQSPRAISVFQSRHAPFFAHTIPVLRVATGYLTHIQDKNEGMAFIIVSCQC